VTSASATTEILPERHEGVAAPAPASTVVIATLERAFGQTGVHTHSRTLHAGLTGIGQRCVVRTPIQGLSPWAPVFAVRPLILNRLKNKTWSTWWLRRWHEAALLGGLTRIVRSEPVAAVVAQCPVSARAAMEARDRVGQNFQVAMVCHFNYSEATEYRDKGELSNDRYFQKILATEKQVLENVDRVIYVSNWARQAVEKERGIRPKSSSVIWNGIEARVGPSQLRRSDIGLGPDDVVLISVGTLEPRKNQISLVRLFAKMSRRHPEAKLVLVGDGPSRGEIDAAIAELGITSKVRLLGFRRDVPDLLPLADLYVHASLLENCPIVLLEAARAGLPVAAVPAGGVPELLAALDGTAINLDDPACLDRLLTNPAVRKSSGQIARSAFERHFTREAMIEAYVRTLRLSADDGGGA